MSAQQSPTIGRTVHYRGPGTANGQFAPKTYPAIITTVHSENFVNLFVMTDVGMMNLTGIEFTNDPTEPSRWSWPPRS